MIFGFCLLAFLIGRPTLYEFDGITYFLYGAAPLDNLNPHHLLWVPVQFLLRGVSSTCFGKPSLILFQVFGLIVSAAALAVFYRLLRKLGAEWWLSASVVLFLIACPPVWLLSSQNLPHPLYFLFTVLFFAALAENPVSDRRACLALVCLILATLFHQMTILLIPAGCAAVAVGNDRSSRRPERAIWWGGCGVLGVALVYLVLGWISGHHTLHEFAWWGTEYMHEIHPLGFSGPDMFPKVIIGLSRTLLQLTPVEDLLLRTVSNKSILLIYTAAGILALTLLILTRRSFRVFKDVLLREPIVLASAVSTGMVSLFALFWEPTNFNFWAINLFPFFILLILLLQDARKSWKVGLSGILGLLCAWNLYANHAVQVKKSVRDSLQELQTVKGWLSGKDILIAFNRGETAGINYDLLFTGLEISSQNQGRALLEDFIIPNPRSQAWQRVIGEEIHQVMAEGGKVYLSNAVMQTSSYQDRARPNPFVPFTRPGYGRIPWLPVSQDVIEFFSRFRLVRSFTIGSDLIWEVDAESSQPMLGKRKGIFGLSK